MKAGHGSEAVTQARCAHPACQCVVAIAEAVVSGGRFYCGPSCAQGRGCLHDDCACAPRTSDADPS